MTSQPLPAMRARIRISGFTMLEVLVALVVTAIGLLGIAKMQALAYASTGTASERSLVALQAAGLAASIRANRAYWATASAPIPLTITGTTLSDNTLNNTATTANHCLSGGAGAPCNAATLAAFDLHTWANALNNLVPGATTTITCPVSQPVNCTIQITWTENAVAINKQGATGAAMRAPTYTLYVQP